VLQEKELKKVTKVDDLDLVEENLISTYEKYFLILRRITLELNLGTEIIIFMGYTYFLNI
jgi:hypothetical protein